MISLSINNNNLHPFFPYKSSKQFHKLEQKIYYIKNISLQLCLKSSLNLIYMYKYKYKLSNKINNF